MDVVSGLSMEGIGPRSISGTSLRASAVSATHMIVQRAALALDIAPEEFEALEPRTRDGKPFLQIADTLVNGAGFCRRLADNIDGEPFVVSLIRSMLNSSDDLFVVDFFENDHKQNCQRSCYRCIQRYGNRGHHGLLDWRLGLSFLRCLFQPDYKVGLDGEFTLYPELQDWHDQAKKIAENIERLNPGKRSVTTIGPLKLPVVIDFTDQHAQEAYVVVHPFWDISGNPTEEIRSTLALLRQYSSVKFVDTFEANRRLLSALENAYQPIL